MPNLPKGCLFGRRTPAGSLPGDVSARGRSFPIEATGTISKINRSNAEFTIQIDEPARILIIGIGRDCKFKQNGAPTGQQILKKGARVKVSYFATIFTGNIAVEIESNPVPEVKRGVIEKIEPLERKLTIWLSNSTQHLAMRWAKNARFIKRGKAVVARDLQENMSIKVSYYSPAFESKYAVESSSSPRKTERACLATVGREMGNLECRHSSFELRH